MKQEFAKRVKRQTPNANQLGQETATSIPDNPKTTSYKDSYFAFRKKR